MVHAIRMHACMYAQGTPRIGSPYNRSSIFVSGCPALLLPFVGVEMSMPYTLYWMYKVLFLYIRIVCDARDTNVCMYVCSGYASGWFSAGIPK